MRLEILREQDRAELAFVEIPSFNEFQPQHLRQIPAAVDHTHGHLAVSEIRALRHISIRPADEVIRVGHVLHLRQRTQLFPQPVGLLPTVLAADIHNRQVILVVAARVLLHEPALPLYKQNEDEQRRRNHKLDAHEDTPQRLSGSRKSKITLEDHRWLARCGIDAWPDTGNETGGHGNRPDEQQQAPMLADREGLHQYAPGQ